MADRDSVPAPKLNVVSKPNSWTKQGETTKREADERNERYAPYWQAFNRYVEENGGRLSRLRSSDQWVAWSLRKGIKLAAVVSRPQRRVIARISLEDAVAKSNFATLYERRAEIEAEIGGCCLEWEERPEGVQSYISMWLNDADFKDSSDWPRQHAWLMEKLLKLREVFAPHIEGLPRS